MLLSRTLDYGMEACAQHVTGWEKWPGVPPRPPHSSRPASRPHRCVPLVQEIFETNYRHYSYLHMQVSRTSTCRRRSKAANPQQARVTAQMGKGSVGVAGSRCCSGPPASGGRAQLDERQLASDTTAADRHRLLRGRLRLHCGCSSAPCRAQQRLRKQVLCCSGRAWARPAGSAA